MNTNIDATDAVSKYHTWNKYIRDQNRETEYSYLNKSSAVKYNGRTCLGSLRVLSLVPRYGERKVF